MSHIYIMAYDDMFRSDSTIFMSLGHLAKEFQYLISCVLADY